MSHLKICVAAAILLILIVPLARAESGKALIENSASFDGKTVTFTGEVIGVFIRGDYAWVNILDNEIAIGVLCRVEDARKVTVIGDYRHGGDTVTAIGTFHAADPKQGGDLDIHADNFIVVAIGKELSRSPSLPLVAFSVVLMVLAIFLAFFLRHIRKEKEKIVPWPFR
jgi:hypothetical protein